MHTVWTRNDTSISNPEGERGTGGLWGKEKEERNGNVPAVSHLAGLEGNSQVLFLSLFLLKYYEELENMLSENDLELEKSSFTIKCG